MERESKYKQLNKIKKYRSHLYLFIMQFGRAQYIMVQAHAVKPREKT